MKSNIPSGTKLYANIAFPPAFNLPRASGKLEVELLVKYTHQNPLSLTEYFFFPLVIDLNNLYHIGSNTLVIVSNNNYIVPATRFLIIFTNFRNAFLEQIIIGSIIQRYRKCFDP